MASNKINMPSGIGGVVRYFDEYKSKFEIKPGTVLVISIIVVILVLFLNLYGKAIFGV